MSSPWFWGTSLRVLQFLQVKEWGPIFWGEPILQKVWIIWSRLLYCIFKGFIDPNSSTFIRFQCILHEWGVLFSWSWNFYKLKRGGGEGGASFWGEAIVDKVWIIWFPLLRFNLKSFIDPYYLPLIRFQCIIHFSGVLFFKSLVISWGKQFCRKSDLFGPPSVFQFYVIYGSKFIHIHQISMHSAWIRRTFLRVWKFLQIKEGRPNFWTNYGEDLS